MLGSDWLCITTFYLSIKNKGNNLGINIGVHEYIKGKYNRNYDSKWWDSCRHSGDKSFIACHFQCEYPDFKTDPQDMIFRPKDFTAAREFVKDLIVREDLPEGNAERLYTLLDKLEENRNLWLEISY